MLNSGTVCYLLPLFYLFQRDVNTEKKRGEITEGRDGETKVKVVQIIALVFISG